MSERDMLCLVCGRRCQGPRAKFLYLRPSPTGGQHQAMGICGARCGRAYDGPRAQETQEWATRAELGA